MAAGILVIAFTLLLSWNLSFVLLEVITLKENHEYKGGKDSLAIYCRKGDEKLFIYAWKSIFIDLNNIPSNVNLFTGENESEVRQKHSNKLSSWFFWPRTESSISLPVFSDYCIGLENAEEIAYKFKLLERSVNYWKLVQLSIGIFLFFSAPALSRNTILYYASGISFGVIASVLIIVFLVSRLTPRKFGAYSVMLFGWSMALYFLQLAWENMKSLLESYCYYMVGYIVATSMISFAMCYRYGPFTDYRTLNLIQWSLQLVALFLIFFSSEFREVTTVIIIVILAVYLFPERWILSIRKLWRKYFPPKVKLLTEAEYIQQANVETQKALEELRSFCQSPDCNSWKVISQIKDPIRFSKFVLGESHLSDEEILDYDYDNGALPSLQNDYNDGSMDNSTDDSVDNSTMHVNNTLQRSFLHAP